MWFSVFGGPENENTSIKRVYSDNGVFYRCSEYELATGLST